MSHEPILAGGLVTRARAGASVLGAILALLLPVGCVTPTPGGAERETSHYEVRTDAAAPAFAARVGASAEQVHAALEASFGEAPSGQFPIAVYRDRARFEGSLAEPLKNRGFVGECGTSFALVFWPDDTRGKDTLAHELVHHFVAELVPDLAYWKDEGLAKALAPKRSAGMHDGVETVRALSDPAIRSHLATLGSLPDGPDYSLRCLVGAAVVRFGLETEPWRDVRDLKAWTPDPDRFLRWLRSRRAFAWRRFAPVWTQED